MDRFVRGLGVKIPDALEAPPTVYVVDDDISVREALEGLIRQVGWAPSMFSSAGAFLAHSPGKGPSCLILDVALPDLNGLELQAKIAGERPDMPIIFVTGFGDVPMTVRAMKAGAIEFLTKPFGDDVLIDAIRSALERSTLALGEAADLQDLLARYATLSLREREVMTMVVSGLMNKQAGAQLNISEITIKAHRGKVMRKMKAKSFADLVNIASKLGIHV